MVIVAIGEYEPTFSPLKHKTANLFLLFFQGNCLVFCKARERMCRNARGRLNLITNSISGTCKQRNIGIGLEFDCPVDTEHVCLRTVARIFSSKKHGTLVQTATICLRIISRNHSRALSAVLLGNTQPFVLLCSCLVGLTKTSLENSYHFYFKLQAETAFNDIFFILRIWLFTENILSKMFQVTLYTHRGKR